jgi:streptogramin lyase
MAVGADGQVYLGTLPSAHIMRVDWQQHKLIDLGAPSPTEQYIWGLTLGSDKKLYGGTYPGAKLIRYDPATQKSEDLGRMSETENYARFVAADNKGFVYVVIGTVKPDLMAYEIATGQHRSILPLGQSMLWTNQVVRSEDGAVYTTLSGKWMRLSGWQVTPTAQPTIKQQQLPDGRTVSYNGPKVVVHSPNGNSEEHATGYNGNAQNIFRIALGPDSRIYGNTKMPNLFFGADPYGSSLEVIANYGGGEFYSFVTWKDRLIGATYYGPSPIMSYHPGQTWKPGVAAQDNPWQIHYTGESIGWRPMSMIVGPLNKIYIGAISDYGQLGGPLCIFDPETGKVEQYMNLIQDQSVSALAALPNGMIVGGTTVAGGGGSHATQTEAKLFMWNPQTHVKYYETIPVPNQGTIDALAIGNNGMVYGFAGKMMFVFDPTQKKIIKTIPNTLGNVIYNAIGSGPKGKLYGLTNKGIFTINESTHDVSLQAIYPGGINGGFAIRGNEIFFTQGPQLLSYQLPNE